MTCTVDLPVYTELAILAYIKNHEALPWKLFRYTSMSQPMGDCGHGVLPDHFDMDE